MSTEWALCPVPTTGRPSDLRVEISTARAEVTVVLHARGPEPLAAAERVMAVVAGEIDRAAAAVIEVHPDVRRYLPLRDRSTAAWAVVDRVKGEVATAARELEAIGVDAPGNVARMRELTTTIDRLEVELEAAKDAAGRAQAEALVAYRPARLAAETAGYEARGERRREFADDRRRLAADLVAALAPFAERLLALAGTETAVRDAAEAQARARDLLDVLPAPADEPEPVAVICTTTGLGSCCQVDNN